MDSKTNTERTFQSIASSLGIEEQIVRHTIQTVMEGFMQSGLGKQEIGMVNEYIPINALYKAVKSGKADLRVLEVLVDKKQPFRDSISDKINTAHRTHGGPIEDSADRYMKDITSVYHRVRSLLEQDAKIMGTAESTKSATPSFLRWLRRRK